MAHPPVQYRDRALRRLSLASKGLAFGAILGTGGLTAAIAHATPAQPASTKTAPTAPKQSTQSGVARNNVPAPASRGQARVPVPANANKVAPRTTVGNTGANRGQGRLAPPPAAPTTPAATSAAPPPAQSENAAGTRRAAR